MKVLPFLLILLSIGCGQTVQIAEPPVVRNAVAPGSPKEVPIENAIDFYFLRQKERVFNRFPNAPRLDNLQSWKEVVSKPAYPKTKEFSGDPILDAREVIFEVVFADKTGQIVTKDIVLLFYKVRVTYSTGFQEDAWTLVRGNFGQELH